LRTRLQIPRPRASGGCQHRTSKTVPILRGRATDLPASLPIPQQINKGPFQQLEGVGSWVWTAAATGAGVGKGAAYAGFATTSAVTTATRKERFMVERPGCVCNINMGPEANENLVPLFKYHPSYRINHSETAKLTRKSRFHWNDEQCSHLFSSH
jgi:hypothetical protein